ncbi:MAG TPA: MFS transporter [Thermohalobaculum sp.]|nr:MFS transporter [Thermohalobaculum sp.]
MWTTIRNSWPLLFGMLLLMMGQGLLATLLTLRASGLGFGDGAIGLLQAGYPAGQIAGCLLAPRLVERAGHARTFGALASIASAAALLHLVTHDPVSWAAMRLVTGFAYAGLFIVAESWLNGHATNRNRGTLLSVYFVTQAVGNSAGQLFLGFSDPQAVLLFVVVSVLISLALVPILLVSQVAPRFERPEHLSWRELFGLSPMGVTGTLLNGVSQGALYVGLPLYATRLGAEPAAAGLFIVALSLGGIASQFPVGRLSDRVDRRHVIVGMAALAALAALWPALGPALGGTPDPLARYALVALLGALVLPGYSVCLAHTNDHLEPGQIVAASGAMVLILGLGITLGVAAGPGAIERLGPAGLFWLIAAVQALTVTTALFRLWRGAAPAETRGTAVAVGQASTPMAARLNPDSPFRADGGQP